MPRISRVDTLGADATIEEIDRALEDIYDVLIVATRVQRSPYLIGVFPGTDKKDLAQIIKYYQAKWQEFSTLRADKKVYVPGIDINLKEQQEFVEQLGEPSQAKLEQAFLNAVMKQNYKIIDLIADYYCAYLSPEVLASVLKQAQDAKNIQIMLAVFTCSEPLTLEYLTKVYKFLKEGKKDAKTVSGLMRDLDRIFGNAIEHYHLKVLKYIVDNLNDYISARTRSRLNSQIDQVMTQAIENNDKKTIIYILENFPDYLSQEVRQVLTRTQEDPQITMQIPGSWYQRPVISIATDTNK